MKTINYIDKDFIERMKKEKIAIRYSYELMKRLEELGIVWSEKQKPTDEVWEITKDPYINLYLWKELEYNEKSFFLDRSFEVYEYQPLKEESQLTKKEQVEKELEELEEHKKELNKKLEELNRPKWDIYKEMPKEDEKFWVISLSGRNIIPFHWTNFGQAKEDFIFMFNNHILHKTQESAELELSFRKELNARRKEFEINTDNWMIGLSFTKKFELYCCRLTIDTKYYFKKEDAQYLINNFPAEVIKAVLFD